MHVNCESIKRFMAANLANEIKLANFMYSKVTCLNIKH
jgi:hypothetical protein